MPWIMYILGILAGLYMLSLGIKDGNIVGGGFWGIVFFAVCAWVGKSLEDAAPPRR